jgi:hypothetical protein
VMSRTLAHGLVVVRVRRLERWRDVGPNMQEPSEVVASVDRPRDRNRTVKEKHQVRSVFGNVT